MLTSRRSQAVQGLGSTEHCSRFPGQKHVHAGRAAAPVPGWRDKSAKVSLPPAPWASLAPKAHVLMFNKVFICGNSVDQHPKRKQV